METFFEWIRGHSVLLAWLFGASAAVFVGSLLAVPWVVIRIPADYFHSRRRFVDRWQPRHPWMRKALLVLKNALGGVLILAGAAMLVLPGQGLLTIFVGLMILDFPGKFALERWLVRKAPVIRTINWMRRRAGRPPLELP